MRADQVIKHWDAPLSMIKKMGVCPGRLESPKVSVHLEPQSVALLGNLVLQT